MHTLTPTDSSGSRHVSKIGRCEFRKEFASLIIVVKSRRHRCHHGPLERLTGFISASIDLSWLDPDYIPNVVALIPYGHLHPAVRVISVVDRTKRLPCFWWHRKRLVLPAIGGFTACSTIKPTPTDGVWVLAEGNVLAYPRRKSNESNRNSL